MSAGVKQHDRLLDFVDFHASTPSEPSKSNLLKIASYTELVPSRSTNTEKGATDANCEGVCDQKHIVSIFVSLFAILVDGMNSVI